METRLPGFADVVDRRIVVPYLLSGNVDTDQNG